MALTKIPDTGIPVSVAQNIELLRHALSSINHFYTWQGPQIPDSPVKYRTPGNSKCSCDVASLSNYFFKLWIVHQFEAISLDIGPLLCVWA